MKDNNVLMSYIRDAMLRTLNAADPKKADQRAQWMIRDRKTEVNWSIEFFEEDEHPLACLEAETQDAPYSSWERKQTPPTGLLYLTDRRIMFVCQDKGGLLTKREPLLLQFFIDGITAIRYDTKGMVMPSPLIHLHVSTTAARGDVTHVTFKVSGYEGCHESTKRFIADVENAKKQLGSMKAMRDKPSPGESPLLSELERLSALHDQKKLSDKEFEAAKKKLLGI